MTIKLTTVQSRDARPEAVLEILHRDGAVIIANHVAPDRLATLRQEMAPHLEATPPGDGLFFGRRTVRFGGVITKAPTSQTLTLDPLVLEVVEKALEPFCDTIQLNLSQAISIMPGEPAQVLHGDDEMWRTPRDGTDYMINAMWSLTDFTEENGATRVVPGSHRGPINRFPAEDEITCAEMPAGSVILWIGSAMHGGGANRSAAPRAGIVMSYCLGWLRQSENQMLVAPPAVARAMDPRLRSLLGYDVHEPNLGHYEGQNPKVLFEDGDLAQPLPFKDFMPDWARQEIEAYHASLQAAE
jgi:hypothetical protein